MLKIQVLGKGLIPRGYGLAPRKDPFMADISLISTILNTSGLKVNYVNPEDGRVIPLTRDNLKRVWNLYGLGNNKASQPTDVPKPSVVEEPKVTVTEPTVVPTKPVDPVDDKKNTNDQSGDKKNNGQGKLKPINAPDDKCSSK